MRKDNIMSVRDWYLIYSKPQQEKIAAENLGRQGYLIYLPFIQIQRRKRGQYQFITEPLFPRYLFIHLNTQTDDWGPIRSTRGVSTLVRFGGIPAKVPTQFIDYLKENEQNKPVEKSATPAFYLGQNVRILSGVMAGYEGIFAATSGGKRVTILLDIVGQATRVEIPIDMLECCE